MATELQQADAADAAGAAAFADALEHTFRREDGLNNKPPEWWADNKDAWPCRYDHGGFDGPKYSFPVAFDPTAEPAWTVRDVFCSLHCMVKFMMVHRCRHLQLAILMAHEVYRWPVDVPLTPASDVELLLDPEHPLALDAWRQLPQKGVHVTVDVPEIVPFRMQKRQVISYVQAAHAGYDRVQEWNRTMAVEPRGPEQEADEPDVDMADVQAFAGAAGLDVAGVSGL